MTYTDDNRGVIQFRERRKQILDCSKLRYGNITPTDCDGLIEYHDKAYVLFEIKYRNAKVPAGQLLALTRSVEDFRRAGKSALLVIAEHDVDDPAQDIDAAECTVREYYWHGQWRTCKESKLKDIIFAFVAKVDKNFF